MGTIISQYKDPYKPMSIMECHNGFERCPPCFQLGFKFHFLLGLGTKRQQKVMIHSQTIHVCYICPQNHTTFTTQNQPNMGKYIPYMDPMGMILPFFFNFWVQPP